MAGRSSTPRRSALVALFISTCLVSFATCSGGDDGTGPGGGSTRPAAVAKVSGDGQSGTVGAALASELVARVTNSAGAALSGVSVSWAVTAGGGSVAPSSSTTDASGQARTTWTLGTTAGANTATATVGSLTPAAFTATGAADAAASVRLNPDSLRFTAVGDTSRLSASAQDRFGNAVTGASFIWTSLDTTIATVDATGLVRSRANGAGSVVATTAGKADTARVRVAQVATTVIITPDADTINAIGDTIVLAAAARDRTGNAIASAGISWSSLDTAVASVTSIGRVISRTAGTARIRAAADAAADTASILSRQIVASVSVSPSAPTIAIGDTTRLTATASDSNGVAKTNASISWSSSASTVASVSTTGLVTGVAAGSANIIATSEGKSDTAAVTVQSRAPSVAKFFASYAFVDAGQATTFGWSVSDPDGDAVSCTLDANGDGATDYTISNCISTVSQRHTFPSSGTFAARLTATDAHGRTSSSTLSITVGARTSFVTGQNADLMLSGIDFNNTGGSLLFNHTAGIATDGTRLYLADRNNNRVLVWTTLPTGNTAPNLVLGQPDFTSNNPGVGRNQMNWPVQVSTDGTRVVVADAYNDRLLIWNSPPTQNGQAADVVVSGDLRWPWGVWTNGTKLVATSTRDGRTYIWNSFPTADNAAASLTLTGDFGTPRTITSNGTALIIGDHNPRVSNQQGNFFWNTFPTTDNQAYSFFRNSPFDPNAAWMQGDITPAGKLILLGRHLHIWNSVPTSAATNPDLTVSYEFKTGDGSHAAHTNGKLFLSVANGNKILAYNALPTGSSQQPDFAVGASSISQNTLETNFFITNPTPATNGTSLLVSSDFDRKLYVWRTIPSASGTHPDVTISVSNQPRDNAIWGNTFVMAGESTVHIWTSIPLNGEPADRTLTGAGSVSFSNLQGVALDDRYFYLSDQNGRIYVWEGLPTSSSEPKYTIMLPSAFASRIASDGEYLVANVRSNHNAVVYRVSELSNTVQPIGTVGGVGTFNLPEDALIVQGRLYVADTGFNRVKVWNDVLSATSGQSHDWILGEDNAADTKPEIGRNKLFWPGALGFDGRYLWVGEFKFSGRLVRFSRP